MQGRVRVDDPQERGAVAEVIGRNPQAIADWRAGKGKAVGFLMGQAMGLLKGKADPGQVKAALEAALEALGMEGETP